MLNVILAYGHIIQGWCVLTTYSNSISVHVVQYCSILHAFHLLNNTLPPNSSHLLLDPLMRIVNCILILYINSCNNQNTFSTDIFIAHSWTVPSHQLQHLYNGLTVQAGTRSRSVVIGIRSVSTYETTRQVIRIHRMFINIYGLVLVFWNF